MPKRRVLVIVPFPLDEAGVANRREQMQEASLGPDIHFDYRPVKAGPSWFDSPHDLVLADIANYEAGMTAQEEGYDAVCIDTMSDSGADALRSVLDIPVIAPAQSSYLMALLLGSRFGILTQWKPWMNLYRKSLQTYGLADKCVGIRSPDIEPDVANLLGGKKEKVLPLFLEQARLLVEDGAHAICLGSTTMHQSATYLSEKLPVPVINPGPLTYKLAETVLGLGLTHSHVAYQKPRVHKAEMTTTMLEAARDLEAGKA